MTVGQSEFARLSCGRGSTVWVPTKFDHVPWRWKWIICVVSSSVHWLRERRRSDRFLASC